ATVPQAAWLLQTLLQRLLLAVLQLAVLQPALLQPALLRPLRPVRPWHRTPATGTNGPASPARSRCAPSRRDDVPFSPDDVIVPPVEDARSVGHAGVQVARHLAPFPHAIAVVGSVWVLDDVGAEVGPQTDGDVVHEAARPSAADHEPRQAAARDARVRCEL